MMNDNFRPPQKERRGMTALWGGGVRNFLKHPLDTKRANYYF
jgi:hypothetical protein